MKNSLHKVFYKAGNIWAAAVVAAVLLSARSADGQTKNPNGMNNASASDGTIKRDPFWPVGYVPERLTKMAQEKPVVKQKSSVLDWSGAMKKVVNSGASKSGNDFYAVINGGIRRVGDTFSVEHEGTTYTWAVSGIKPDGKVNLKRVSAR